MFLLVSYQTLKSNGVSRLKQKKNISIDVFSFKNKPAYPIYLSKENFENPIALLQIESEDKLCNVYIKDFNRFMCNKTRHKDEKEFCMNYWQCFSNNEILTNHREVCLEINRKQATKMSEKGINT